MENELIIQKPVLKRDGEVYTYSAVIKFDGEARELFFRTSGCAPTATSDPFLAGVLLLAMKTNSRIKVEGKISEKLLKNIETIQDIFHRWYPDLSKIQIDCEEFADVRPVQNANVGCFFSGGVDSFYTLLKYKSEITSLVFVHGFDVLLGDTALRAKVSSQIEKASMELGLPLIQVETNVRDIMDPHLDWGKHYHGAAMACIALFLSSQFKRIFIGSTNDYAILRPWGSHPLLDPLWSTESLEVIHDGCEANRLQKIERIVSNETARNYLRVCWEHPDASYNCGKCEKCLRTMANLRVLNALDKVQTFSRPLELALLARVMPRSPAIRLCVTDTLNAARKKGADRPLVHALEDMLDDVYFKGVKGWPRRAWGFFNRKVLFKEKYREQVPA